MRKVLVVDDDDFLQNLWEEVLRDEVKVIHAFTIEEAERKFAENSDIDAIVIDSCVPGWELNTLPLVQKFRATFKGPMLAISDIPLYSGELVRAGCSHKCKKEFVPRELCEILGL